MSEIKKKFEEEAYEDYRELILELTGGEPALPKEGAPTTYKYNLLLEKYENKIEDYDLMVKIYEHLVSKIEKAVNENIDSNVVVKEALIQLGKHKARMSKLKYGTWAHDDKTPIEKTLGLEE